MKARVLCFVAALALIAGFGTGTAHAQIDWCAICADTGGCWECCRCGGGSRQACLQACGFPFADGKLTVDQFVAALSNDCSASQEQVAPAVAAEPVTEAVPALIAAPSAA